MQNQNRTGTKNNIKRGLAFLLAAAMLFTSISLDGNTLKVKAASFSNGGKYLQAGSKIGMIYRNDGADVISITGGSFYVSAPANTTISGSAAVYISPGGGSPESATQVGTGVVNSNTVSQGILPISFTLNTQAVLAPGETAGIVVSIANITGESTSLEFFTDDSLGDGWIFEGGSWQGSGRTIEPTTVSGGSLPDATVSFSPNVIYLAPGQTYQLSPSFSPAYNRTVTYASNNSFAQVNSDTGLITANSPGTSTIVASGSGVISGNVTVNVISATVSNQTFTGNPLNPTPVFSPPAIPTGKYSADYSGNVNAGQAAVNITGKDEYSMYRNTVNFDINRGDMATFYNGRTPGSESFEINTLNSTVTAGSFNYGGKSYSMAAGDFTAAAVLSSKIPGSPNPTYRYSVTLTGSKNLSGTVTGTYDVTGEAINIGSVYIMKAKKSSVNYGTTGQPPADPKDFVTFYDAATNSPISGIPSGITVNYNPAPGEPGEYQVVATSTLYEGSLTDTFKITRSINSGVTITLNKNVWVYTGNGITPEPTVKLGGTTLDPNTDYDVKYTNNIEVGTGTVTIQGKGLYTGKKTANFQIVPSVAESAEVIIDNYYVGTPENGFKTGYSQTYTGSPIKPGNVSVKIDGTPLLDSGDFTVTYGANTNVGVDAGTVIVNLSAEYGSQTITAYFAISPLELINTNVSIEGTNTSEYEAFAVYNPAQPVVLPEFDISLGYGYKVSAPTGPGGATKPLIKDTDYTVSYIDNDKAGFATLVVKGKGNYSGTANQRYIINRKSLESGHTIEAIAPVSYTGAPTTPTPHIYDGVTPVPEGNYSVSYENNVNVTDAARVIVTGTGNYTGTITADYSIVPKTIQGGNISYRIGNIIAGTGNNAGSGEGTLDSTYTGEFTGMAIRPLITVVEDTVNLKAGRDYTVTYLNNTNVAVPNEAVAVVKGIGNYDGVMNIKFGINPRPLSSTGVQIVAGPDKNAAGFPVVHVKDTVNGISRIRTEGVDFQVNYGSASASIPGEYKGLVTGMGNYTGSSGFDFIIGNPVSVCKVYWMNQHTSNSGTGQFEEWTAEKTIEYIGNAKPVIKIVDNSSNPSDVTSRFKITYDPADTYSGGSKINLTLEAKDAGYYGEMERSYNITKRTISDNDSFPGDFIITLNGKEKENILGNLNYDFDVTGSVVDNPSFKILYHPNDNFTGGGAKINSAPLDVTSEFELKNADGTPAKLDLTDEKVGHLKLFAKADSANFSGTRSIDYTAKKIDIATDPRVVINPIPEQEYTGAPIEPGFTVKCGSQPMVKGIDYEVVRYTNNTAAGTNTAQVEITGKGIYKNNKTANFTIKKGSFSSSNVTIEAIPNQTYDNTEKKPVLIVKRAGKLLNLGTDYSVSYSDNTNPGQATATVTGMGDFEANQVEAKFNIVADIGDSAFKVNGVNPSGYKLKNGVLTANDGSGDTFPATLTVTNDNTGTPLNKDVHYSVIQQNLSTPGLNTGSVTVKGIAPYYKGSKTISGISVYGDISEAVWAGQPGYYPFDGVHSQEPKPTLQYNGAPLYENTDYTIDGYLNSSTAGAGSINITGKGKFAGSSLNLPYNIWYDLSQATISGIEQSYPYNGSSIKPPAVVKINGQTLTADSDYKIIYKNSSDDSACVDAGLVTVIVSAVEGRSANSKSTSYSITGHSGGVISVSSISNQTYTGSPLEPPVGTVTYRTIGGTVHTLTPKDYTVTYSDNTNAGTATVTVQGKGNFEGTGGTTFTIDPKNMNRVNINVTEATYTGAPITPVFTIADKDTGAILPASNYQFTPATQTVAGNHTLTFNGLRNYTGSTTATFTIKPLNLSSGRVTLRKNEETYTGETITPQMEVTIPDADGNLVNITSECNINYGGVSLINAGEYPITVSAPSNINLTGTLTTTFTIKPKNITEEANAFTVNPQNIPKQDYNPAGVTISGISVLDNKWGNSGVIQKSLTKNTDYTVSYSNNTIATADAKLIISGTGNYIGTVVRGFKIGTDISDANFSISPTSFTYNGQSQKPAVSPVIATNGTTLREGVDYTINYSEDTTNSGSKEVSIVGTGTGYYGTAQKTYEIKPKSIRSSDLHVKLDLPRNSSGYYAVYTGSQIKPDVSVRLLSDGSMLEENRDYTLEYGPNILAGGQGRVTVKPSGNYTSTTAPSYTFNILPKSGSENYRVEFLLGEDSYDYDYGNQVTPPIKVYHGSDLLIGGTDYALPVTYTNNTKPGTATVTANMQGNYSGAASAEFKVVGNLSDATITDLFSANGYARTGSEVLPKLKVVFHDGTELKLGEDYRLINATPNTGNWATAESAEVTLEAASDFYKGTGSITYKINPNIVPGSPDDPWNNGGGSGGTDPANPTGYEISGIKATVAYSENSIHQIPTSVTHNGTAQTVNTSGIVYKSTAGDDCIEPGTVTMEIPVSGSGGSRTLTATYRIIKGMSHSSISAYLAPGTYQYAAGTVYEPTVYVTDNKSNRHLELNKDFTVTYSKNNAPGTGIAKVTGKGDYVGNRLLPFSIAASQTIMGLSAVPVSNTSVRLSWSTNASGITGYTIRYTGGSNGSISAGATARSAVVTGLNQGQRYTFYVTPLFGSGVGTAGVTSLTLPGGGSVAPTPTPPNNGAGNGTPATVTGITGSSPKPSTAVINWTASASGSKFKVYRSGDNVNFSHCGTLPTNATSFTDVAVTGLRPGTYYYKVRPFVVSSGNYIYGTYSQTVQVVVK